MDEEQESGSDLELEEDWEAVPTVGTHTEAQDGGVDGVNVLGRWNGTGSCPGASITISLTGVCLLALCCVVLLLNGGRGAVARAVVSVSAFSTLCMLLQMKR